MKKSSALAAPNISSDVSSDLGNALWFQKLFGDTVKFISETNEVIIWNGDYYEPDKTNKVYAMAIKVVEEIVREACDMPGGDEKEKYLSRALRSQSDAKISAIVSTTSKLDGMTISIDECDKDPHLLQLENGRYDLKSNKFTPSCDVDKSIVTTGCVKTHHEQGARSDLWEDEFLPAVLPDIKRRKYFQKIAGLCLSGETEKLIMLLVGPTNTGKTTTIETLYDLLSDKYACVAPTSLFLYRYHSQTDEYALAMLKGARMVVADELPKGTRFNELLIKQLSGGATINGRFPRGRHFKISPTWKILLGMNHIPNLREISSAIFDRLKIVKFESVIKKPDSTFQEKLKPEYPGILNWMIEGWKLYQKEGLQEPESVTSAVEEYREEQDILERMLQECCVFGEDEYVPTAHLWEVCKKWCIETGNQSELRTMNTTQFGLWLSDHDPPFSPDKNIPGHTGFVCRRGLRLNERLTNEIKVNGIQIFENRDFKILCDDKAKSIEDVLEQVETSQVEADRPPPNTDLIR